MRWKYFCKTLLLVSMIAAVLIPAGQSDAGQMSVWNCGKINATTTDSNTYTDLANSATNIQADVGNVFGVFVMQTGTTPAGASAGPSGTPDTYAAPISDAAAVFPTPAGQYLSDTGQPLAREGSDPALLDRLRITAVSKGTTSGGVTPVTFTLRNPASLSGHDAMGVKPWSVGDKVIIYNIAGTSSGYEGQFTITATSQTLNSPTGTITVANTNTLTGSISSANLIAADAYVAQSATQSSVQTDPVLKDEVYITAITPKSATQMTISVAVPPGHNAIGTSAWAVLKPVYVTGIGGSTSWGGLNQQYTIVSADGDNGTYASTDAKYPGYKKASFVVNLNGVTAVASGSSWVFSPASQDSDLEHATADTDTGNHTLSNSTVYFGRFKAEQLCNSSQDYMKNYSGAGIRTWPDSSCENADLACENGDASSSSVNCAWRHCYGVYDGNIVGRVARAAGSSRITSVNDLWGAGIINGEGWMAYLSDSTANTTLSGLMPCKPGFHHDDVNHTTPTETDLDAYYQCRSFIIPNGDNSTSTLYSYSCSNKYKDFSGGTVRCSAWDTDTKTTNKPSAVALSNATWVASKLECNSNWSQEEGIIANSHGTCYSGPPHSILCDETRSVPAATINTIHSCSWNGGVWLGGDSSTAGLSTTNMTVTDSSNTTVSDPIVDPSQPVVVASKTVQDTNYTQFAKSCSGWYSLACFQSASSTSATSFPINVSFNASHELGINRTFVGLGASSAASTPLSTASSGQLTSREYDAASRSIWTSVCQQTSLTGNTQSCYQPCARYIVSSTTKGFAAMVPCMGSSATDYSDSTSLTASHEVPIFTNGTLSSNFQEGANNYIKSGAESPTGNFAASSNAAQVKIDDTAPGLGSSSLAVCNTSSGGPSATANTGVNPNYWNLASTNLIALKGYSCDAQSGVKSSRMYYQLCSSSCDSESSWSPSLAAATILSVAGSSPSSGKATYSTSANHNFNIGDHVKISGIYVSGSAANGYNSSDATITAITPTTFTTSNSTTGTATVLNAKADPVGVDFPIGASPRQIGGTASARLSSSGSNGCSSSLSTPAVSASVALPDASSTCSFLTTGLASGSKVRFWMASQDAAYNVSLSPVGSTVTMDGVAPVVQSSIISCASANAAESVKVTAADGASTKTGTVAGYWGSSSENFMLLSSSACDDISGINKAEIHYQTCPSSSACTNTSDWTPSITTANASSVMGTQTGGTDSARLSTTGCAREIPSTQPKLQVDVPDTSGSAATCKFKATNLSNGDRVRFVNIALDGAGIYAVSDPSSVYIIDNDTPTSVDPISPSCGTSGYPTATNNSGATKTGPTDGYWSPAIQASMNLNAAACDTFSGVARMEIHYQTCTPSTGDACASSSTNWTPSITSSSWGTQTGGTTTNRLDSSCTRTVSSPASNSVTPLPSTKSLTSSTCKFLTTGLADTSKVRFVLLAQDGAGNNSVSGPGSAITMDGTDPKTVATTASTCTTAVDPGVGVSKSDGAIKTGTADGYWSPVVASQMLLQSAGCDVHSGIAKAEMHYQTCAASADCSVSTNWTPTINSSASAQTSASASDQTNRLSTATDCAVSVASPSGGARVNIPPSGSSGCKFLTTGLADGSKVRFVLFNTDAAGNTNASAPSTTYIIDGSPPGSSSLSAKKYNPSGTTDAEQWTTLTAESGSSQTWTNTTKVRIIWDNSADLSGVVSAKTAYTPGSCTTLTEDPVTGTSKDFDQDRSQQCRQGQHVFKMWAKDGAGNQTADAAPATLKFHYDSDPTVESSAAYASWTAISALQPQKLQPQSFTAVNGASGCTPGGSSSTTYNSSNSFTICWTNPTIDAAALGNTIAPIKSVHFRVGGDEVQTISKASCLLPGSTCSISTSEAPGLSVGSNGSHPVTVWLEDQAGNSDLKQSVAGTLKLFITTICP